MTRRTLSILILAFVTAAVPAMATVVNVDFSGLSTTDINVGGTPGTLGIYGVTFQYDPQGSTTAGFADTGGIFGFSSDGATLGGALNLNFFTPAVGLAFNYSVTGGTVNEADALFSNTDFVSSTSGIFQYGSFASQVVAPFDQVSLFFGDGNAFNMDTIAYDTAGSVPEPGTIALLACGLLGLCGRRFLRSRP